MTTSCVARLIDRGEEFLLVDCRTKEEWEADGLQDALNLPLQQCSTRMHELEAHRTRPIVTYCRTGRRSAIVTKYLHMSGFLHVRSMAGGIEAWLEHSSSKSGH